MQIPSQMSGLKWLFALWGVTAVIWSILEGDLQRVQLFGSFTTLTGLAYLFQRTMTGRRMARTRWLLTMSLWGLALGVGSVMMALFLMAVKTGLHAHGAEFSTADIAHVWQQLPLWSLAGMLAGLGIGLIWAASVPPRD